MKLQRHRLCWRCRLVQITHKELSPMKIGRRQFLAGSASAYFLAALSTPAMAAATVMTVHKDPNCGCCHHWADAMKKAGFDLRLHDVEDPARIKARLGFRANSRAATPPKTTATSWKAMCRSRPCASFSRSTRDQRPRRSRNALRLAGHGGRSVCQLRRGRRISLRQFRFRAGPPKELSSRVTNVAVLDLCQTNEMAGALEFTSVRSVPGCAVG